jgi:hypothetical protein
VYSLDEYEKQAKDFLEKFGLKASATYVSHEPPAWDEKQEYIRPKYRVRISRKKTRKSLTFNFWDSIANDQKGIRPSAYSVLACISSDQYCPDTFKDFCSDYGYDTDSIKVLKTFKVCSKFARRIRNFFTETELEELSEIQ